MLTWSTGIDNRGVAEEIIEGGTIVPPSQEFGNRNLTFFHLLGYHRHRVIKHGFRVGDRCDDLSDAVGGVNGGGLCGDGGLGG